MNSQPVMWGLSLNVNFDVGTCPGTHIAGTQPTLYREVVG